MWLFIHFLGISLGASFLKDILLPKREGLIKVQRVCYNEKEVKKMKLSIEEAIAWIHSRLPFGIRPGLDRVEALLDLVDHPENKIEMIHVAGTNGKGSTVSYLKNMLESAGLTVGTYTSPYIEVFNERIAINGVFIADEELIALVEKYQPLVESLDAQTKTSGITEFELLTVLAFDYFLQNKVDVAIIEVGLGGLLDSTNVITPILSAITTIGLDHTDILGATIEEIAVQKAGIIKPGIPVVTGNLSLQAQQVIDGVAQKVQAKVYRLNKDYQVFYQHPDPNWGEVFDFYNEQGKIKHLKTPLLGAHQVENAGLAIELFFKYCQLKGIIVQQQWIKTGLSQTTWPARMEKISTEPLIILDGAHNDHAMKRLVDNMKREFANRKIYVLFSALETKDISSMLKDLTEIPQSQILITTFDNPKAIRLAADYQAIAPNKISVASSWQFGLADLLEKMTEDDLLLITGSLYFVSEIRQFLLSI